MKKSIPMMGIAVVVVYFISVALFLITKTDAALTAWEIMTIVGAVATLIVTVHIAEVLDVSAFCRRLVLAFMACTCALTSLAHFVNITVTRRLIAEGINVPDYFRIGFDPSVEMAADYVAWGLFTGLAFLFLAVGAKKVGNRVMRVTLAVCGALCFVGFIGVCFNENLWYFAPMGYGMGMIVLCAELLARRNRR